MRTEDLKNGAIYCHLRRWLFFFDFDDDGPALSHLLTANHHK